MSDPRPLSRPRRISTCCVRCRLRTCVCAEIPRVENETRIVIVRHAAELSRQSNTAHFASLALARCELVDYGRSGVPFDEGRVPTSAGTYVLFPGGAPATPDLKPERLIILDGSWSQARRMRQRIVALRGLPFLTLPAPTAGRDRLRRQRDDTGMSTLEAIARAVALFEGDARAAPLEQLHDAIVRACHT